MFIPAVLFPVQINPVLIFNNMLLKIFNIQLRSLEEALTKQGMESEGEKSTHPVFVIFITEFTVHFQFAI